MVFYSPFCQICVHRKAHRSSGPSDVSDCGSVSNQQPGSGDHGVQGSLHQGVFTPAQAQAFKDSFPCHQLVFVACLKAVMHLAGRMLSMARALTKTCSLLCVPAVRRDRGLSGEHRPHAQLRAAALRRHRVSGGPGGHVLQRLARQRHQEVGPGP